MQPVMWILSKVREKNNKNISNELDFFQNLLRYDRSGSRAKYDWPRGSFTLHATHCGHTSMNFERNKVHS